ncbi:MAG: inner membrane protein [Acidobacteriota bacterium]|jgi:membrane-bound metal-dependent hydrolase YbcI (DUF457 family)|nr:inner membrane protein [Acidobacteriota bacterium]
MPLPIAHSLIGASVVTLCRPRSPLKDDWRLFLFGAFLAVIPDFDFFLIWGLHLSREWHRGVSHSIFFALMLTGATLLVAGLSRTGIVLACGAAFLSHGILDFLSTRQGMGVELLWPFSDDRLKLGVVGISEFSHGINLIELVKASLIELIIFAPILLGALLVRKYLAQASTFQTGL